MAFTKYLADDDLSPARNNLTLARLILASAVIYTHSYGYFTGILDVDPLTPVFGLKISHLAVDGFFFLSGFLVYRSLMRRHDLGKFIKSRFLRVWPGLTAAMIITILVGYFFSRTSGPGFFLGETATYAISSLVLQPGMPRLTGVYCGDQLCIVNYSLWTISWEVRCYALLALLFLLGLASEKRMVFVVFPATVAFVLIVNLGGLHSATFDAIWRLWGMFAMGIGVYIFRARVPLNWWLLPPMMIANLLLPKLPINMVVIAYIVLLIGFHTKPISAKWPDYSYGMYIYSFPVMLLIYASGMVTSYEALAIANFAATLVLAAISWHFIEAPGMKMRLPRFGSAGRAIPG